MKLADLSPARRAWLARCLYDSLIEKHEGPWDWGGYLLDSEDHAEFLVLGGYEVLLPVSADHNPYITLLHGVADAMGECATLWLKDLYLSSRSPSYTAEDAWGWAGHLAVCQRAGRGLVRRRVLPRDVPAERRAGGSCAHSPAAVAGRRAVLSRPERRGGDAWARVRSIGWRSTWRTWRPPSRTGTLG